MIKISDTKASSNGMSWPNAFAGMTAYSIMFWVVLNEAPDTNADMFGQWHNTDDDREWSMRLASTRKISVVHHNGTAAAASTVSTNTISATEPTHIAFVWDGSNVQYYFNGAAGDNPAFSTAIRTASSPPELRIGSRSGATNGAAIDIGEIMLWKNLAITAEAVAAIYACQLRSVDTLDFYFRGLHLDDPEFFGAVTTNVSSTTVEHRLGTGPWIEQGQFFKSVPMGSLLKVIDKDLELPETNNKADILAQVINKDLTIVDGTNNNEFDPAGFREEAATSSDNNITTTWKTIYPPFIKRTQWT